MIRVTWWLCVGLAASEAGGRLLRRLSPELAVLPYEVVLYVLMLAPVAIYAHLHHGVPWEAMFPVKRIGWRLALPVLVTTVGEVILNHQMIVFCMALDPGVVAAIPQEEAPYWETPSTALLGPLIGDAIVPAIAEEALLRGLLLQSLLATMSPRRAIASSAFLFAVIHFRVERMPDILIGGLIYGWLFVRTGSLLPSIVAHMSYNALVHLHHLLSLANDVATNEYGFLSIQLTVVGVALMALGLAFARRELNRAVTLAAARGQPKEEPIGYAA